MTELPIVYLDSCFFVALFNNEKGRAETCLGVLEDVKDGKVQAVISTAVIAETRNPPGSKADSGLVFDHAFFRKISLDISIAHKARGLLEAVPGIKGLDAVHLATAVDSKALWFFTYDDKILQKNGQADFQSLEIITPSFPWRRQPSLPGVGSRDPEKR